MRLKDSNGTGDWVLSRKPVYKKIIIIIIDYRNFIILYKQRSEDRLFTEKP